MSNNLNHAKLYDRIYDGARQIPAGKVSTYGQVAAIIGEGCTARMVGYAMAALKVEDKLTPWQRVINAKGEISPRGGAGPTMQRVLLEREGVTFNEKDRVDFNAVGWEGPAWEWLEKHNFHPAPSLNKKSRKKPAKGEQLSLFDEE